MSKFQLQLVMMKIHIAALLVLVVLIGGVTTACAADTSTQRESPHAVATPLGPDLVGEDERIYWVYESEVNLSPEDTPFISFRVDGFGGQAHCNGYGAPFTYASDGRIKIEDVVSRLMGCGKELDELETQFLDKLRVVDSITRVDDKLYLAGPAGQLVFRPLRADDTDVIPESFRNPNVPIPTRTPRPQPIESTWTLPPPLPESPYP